MNFRISYFLYLIAGTIFLISCGSNSDSQDQKRKKDVVFGKIELSNGWALPASKGQNSQAYLNIDNGTASNDTLQSVESDVAGQINIYQMTESNGELSPVTELQIIPPAMELHFKPDSLYIGLNKLSKDLQIGDSLDLQLNFARVGTLKIRIPIRHN